MDIPLFRFVLGRSLANRENGERKITTFEGVPAMGLDGLGSSSYGPEAALAILIPAGALGLAAIGKIMLPILVLLGILYVSYRQTIRAYPNNGGAYIVARENLGTRASLLAATALMIDYVLNVAVAISAGVGALVSAAPALHPFTLPLCLAILVIVTLLNLRGTPDAGRVFAVPTYLFIASFLGLLALGVWKTAVSGGHPQPVVAPPALSAATENLSLWLVLRAFAAGCTAMTGVEAISNGVSAFRDPVVKRAQHTLGVVCGVLAILLAGIAYLAHTYGIGAMDQGRQDYQSVLSQLAGAVVGHNVFYDIAMGSALCVLCLSANTSFVDFPRLCRLVAEDDFLPRSFAQAGRRLVFSVGILYLAATSGLLLIVFGGVTDRLIPLFAIGAFLTFTLSQLGMVGHWRRVLHENKPRAQGQHPRLSLVINAVGTAATAAALAIIIVAKFTEGAWITIAAIPCGILLLRSIRSYYVHIDAQLERPEPLDLTSTEHPVVLVVMKDWNRPFARALKFAMRLSHEVIAVHLTDLPGPDCEERRDQLLQGWSRQVEMPAKTQGLPPPKLMMMEATHRNLRTPLLQMIQRIQADYPQRLLAVLIPQVVKSHWWQYLLHTHRARRLRSALIRYGGPGLVVIDVPWYLEGPRTEEVTDETKL